ncbi:hypothetical protein E2P81_ATG00182 [Venturia nashicola]|nr:hypothetical protein E2P81_ATG00182 [Venturia nashicola]
MNSVTGPGLLIHQTQNRIEYAQHRSARWDFFNKGYSRTRLLYSRACCVPVLLCQTPSIAEARNVLCSFNRA